MRPPFAYYGGKTTLAPSIVSLLPPHGHYVEPFCGSLSVLLAKPRSTMETVNDIDGDVMTFWRMLRDRPEDLARVCALTPHSRAEHVAAADLDSIDDLERARRVWVRLSQGRAGTLRTTGWRFFRDRAGSSIGMGGYLAGYVDRMVAVAERIQGVSLECMDALELIVDYGQHEDTLIYADPPYLASTRGGANNYRHELRQDDEHRALAEVLRECRGAVVLSGYASQLYDDDLYADWSRVAFPAFTGNGTNGSRTEVLWSNRPLGSQQVLDLSVVSVGGTDDR